MAWSIAAYAIALSALAVAATVIYGIIHAARALIRAERTLARVGEETEASLRQARQLAQEAAAITHSGRRTFESIAAFAEGARALGEAAQAAGEAATQVMSFWRDRLTFARRADSADSEERASEWLDLLRRLWNAWSSRQTGNTESAAEPEDSPYAGASADQH